LYLVLRVVGGFLGIDAGLLTVRTQVKVIADGAVVAGPLDRGRSAAVAGVEQRRRLYLGLGGEMCSSMKIDDEILRIES
jgi:hypothetical protein